MFFSWRLFAFTEGERWMLALAVLFGLLTTVAGVSRLALSGYALALVIRGEPSDDVIFAVSAIVGAIFVRALFQYLKETTGHRAALAIQVRMRRQVYGKAIELGPGTLDQKRSGDLLISLVEGIDQLESYFGEYLAQFVVAMVAPIGLFIFMAWLDTTTAIVYLLAAMATLFFPAVFNTWTASSGGWRRGAYADLSSEFLDSVQGLATLKAFGQSGPRGEFLAEKARNVYRSTMAILAANQATTGVTWLGITVGAGVALGWGAFRVEDGSLELTTLLVVVMLGVEVFRPLRELTNLYHRGMSGAASAAAVFDLLESEPEVKDTARDGSKLEAVEPTLELGAVTFQYPTRETPALEDVSFRLEAGESVAVVGASGAGKSTLVWLALRFFDPTRGTVLIGGHDVKDLPLSAVREQIAVVTQDTYLFHGTVAYNLRFGKPDATEEELEEATRAANAYEFIRDLPEGLDTVIGERGIKLSGGQRQRIAIARALLKDAPILILDEALSSVDAENEAMIQQALDRLMKGRTTLVIAHRLSSVINADRTLVVEDGRLVEEGKHSDLLAGDGAYTRLMEAQIEAGVDDLRATDEGRVSLLTAPEGPTVESRPTQEQQEAPLVPWTTIFARLLGLTRSMTWMLVATFLLGVAPHRSPDRYRRRWRPDSPTGSSRAAALQGLSWFWESWRFLRPFSTGGSRGSRTTWRSGCWPRCASTCSASWTGWRRPIWSGGGRATSSRLVTADIETIEFFFAHTIAPAFVALVVPLAVLVTVAAIQWPLALLLLVFLAFVAYTPFQARNKLDRLGFESREQLGEVNAHMVDGVQGIREIVAFGQESRRLDEVERNHREFGEYRLRFLKHLSAQRILIEMANGLGGLSVLAAGAYFESRGDLSADILPLLTIIALSSFIPVSEVAQVAKQLADTLGSSRRLFAVHDEPVPVTDGPGVMDADKTVDGALGFNSVDFRYEPGLPLALRGVRFSAEPGQRLALVGRSGAGKTTAAHLLLRFWDPNKGEIDPGLQESSPVHIGRAPYLDRPGRAGYLPVQQHGAGEPRAGEAGRPRRGASARRGAGRRP